MKKGFTLIELLVVVLIIGILAAVALPQYTKAVERARMSEAIQILEHMAKAQALMHLEEGEYATTLLGLNEGTLPITVPANGSFSYQVPVSMYPVSSGFAMATRSGGIYSGSSLQITITPNGNSKKCMPSGSKGSEFCALAETYGYELSEPLTPR